MRSDLLRQVCSPVFLSFAISETICVLLNPWYFFPSLSSATSVNTFYSQALRLPYFSCLPVIISVSCIASPFANPFLMSFLRFPSRKFQHVHAPNFHRSCNWRGRTFFDNPVRNLVRILGASSVIAFATMLFRRHAVWLKYKALVYNVSLLLWIWGCCSIKVIWIILFISYLPHFKGADGRSGPKTLILSIRISALLPCYVVAVGPHNRSPLPKELA